MYTTIEAVRALLAQVGQHASDADVKQAMKDALLTVRQFDFRIRGTVTKDGTDTLHDSNASFLGRVVVGAQLSRKSDKSSVKEVISDTAIRTTEEMNFLTGQRYSIVDLQRYEMAQRYKAASLVLGTLISQGVITAGGSAERLGPISVTSGEWNSQWGRSSGATNPFEEEFLKIAGLHFATA